MKKGAWAVLFCYFLWGMLPIYWKLLDQVNSGYILASRIVWSMVFCLIVIIIEGKTGQIKAVFKDKKECLLLSACGVMISINWGVYIFAVNSGHILESSLAYYMNPIIAILIATAFFHERLNFVQWISVLIAFAGVMISVLKYGEIPYLAVIIAASFAVYSALKKKVHVDSEISIFMEALTMTPFALIFIAYAEIHGMGSLGFLSGWQFLLLPLCGVVTSIPLVFFAWGIKETSLSLTGILMYINPTLQLLVGVLIYHETFTATSAVTFGFVWIALILFVGNNLWELRKQKREIAVDRE